MHDALAAPVQTSVDVKSVQARLNQRAAIDATRVVSVTPGYNTTTIDAVVTWQQDAGLPRDPRCLSNSRRSWPREIWNANGPSSARCQVGSARSRTL